LPAFCITSCLQRRQKQQAKQQAEQLPQLPADVLPHVLAHIPQQQRLGSCSLVSRSMRAAAITATRTIQLPRLTTQATADSLCAWLQRHGSEGVTRLEVNNPDFSDNCVLLPLPWQQLPQLQHLLLDGGPGLQLGLENGAVECSDPNQQQQQQGVRTRRGAAATAAASATAAAAARDCSTLSLAALTALTSLSICCTLEISCSVTRWVTSQLRHLTGLCCLKLSSISRVESHWLEYPMEDNPALGEVIGQLVLLTHLEITQSVDGRALAAASNLTRLKDLRLMHVGKAEHPVKLLELPRSLSYLNLHDNILDCAVESSWEMPALLELDVSEWEGSGFKPEVIARMSELRWLDISVEVTEEPAWGIADIVAVLPQLQRLQKLSLYGMQVWPEFHDAVDTFLAEKTAAAKQAMAAAEAGAAASCKALTGSFDLSSLRLRDCWLPGAAVSRMFPASGWLPFLQVIDVTCCEGTLEFFDFQEEPFDPASDVRR
jgi:hypothetical protein